MKHSCKNAKSFGKASVKSSPAKRRSWNIADKKRLTAEAKEKGIRVTARSYNVPNSVLNVWMLQDFSDVSDTKKRLPGAGRPLKYGTSIDVTLRDWVVQKMVKERVFYKEIRQKAVELILPQDPNFHASPRWISNFLHRHGINLKTKTFNEKVKPPSDGSAHIQGGGHNQHQQLPTNNISPVKSFHTTVKNEDDKMTISQPLMEDVIVDGLVPIEDNVEIISNCDMLDFGDLDVVITNNSTTASSQLFTTYEGVEQRMPPVGNSDIEFKPAIQSINLPSQQTSDIKSNQTGFSRKRKRYDQSVEIILKDWILQRMATEKRRVSYKELRQKALELVLPYNPNFLASQSWIRSFLLRSNISLNAMARSIRCSKPKTTRKKNDKMATTQYCTVKSQKYQRHKGHSRNQDGETSSMLEQQENTCPLSGLQRHHDNVFNLTHTFTQGLQKIGRPKELLKQDINWKRMVLSIPKENVDQLSMGRLKAPAEASHRLSIGAKTERIEEDKKPRISSTNKKQIGRIKKQVVPYDHTPWGMLDRSRLPPEANQRLMARNHELLFSTVQIWTKQDFGDLPGVKKRLPGSRSRLTYDQGIDVALKEWVQQRVGENKCVTRIEIRQKAMEMISPHNPNFRASSGWVEKFLTRHNLSIYHPGHINGRKRQKIAASSTAKRRKQESYPLSLE